MTPVTTPAGERTALIPADAGHLAGTLAWPTHPSGVVLFAQGNGGGQSPGDLYVARQLRAAGLSTLLVDPLTGQEAADRATVSNVALLGRRLLAAARWAATQPETADLPIGLFGAGTGGAAALIAAAAAPDLVDAVVACGGRPDLAGDHLARVRAPTLLIVGARDESAVGLNREGLTCLTCSRRLVAIPGATQRFQEPGTLEGAARWAAEWFVHYLAMERTWQGRGGGRDYPRATVPASAFDG